MAAEPSSEPSQPDSKPYGRDDLIEFIRCSDAANEWGDRLAALEFLVGALAIEPDNEGIWRCLVETVRQSAAREACIARVLAIAADQPLAPRARPLVPPASEDDSAEPAIGVEQGEVIPAATAKPRRAPRSAQPGAQDSADPEPRRGGKRAGPGAVPAGSDGDRGRRGRTDSAAQPAGDNHEPAGRGRRGARKAGEPGSGGTSGRRRKAAPAADALAR
jgi:hypothetical protein